MSIMNQDDRDVVILASTIRGNVKCVHSTERKCGYIIRPELWFTVIEAGTGRALTNHGLEIRSVYSKPSEITTILNMIRGLEDLSTTTEGLHLVRELNGVLRQPRNHEGVLFALEIIESSREIKSESTFRQSPE
jgi:hypothetical protein